MTEPETDSLKTEHEHWQAVLDYRTKRFAKFVAMKAPHYILCSDFMLLMKALAGFAPEAFGQVQGEFFQKAARSSMSRCAFCGDGPIQQREDWCARCEAEARAEAAADDAESHD